MYKFPHGLEELEGVANRTDFDLGSHTKNQSELSINAKVVKNTSSNAKLAIQDRETKEWTVPYVIEPAAGVERGVLAVLNESYEVQELEDGKERTVLSLKPHLSPIKAAVIPLKRNNEDLVSAATSLKGKLQGLGLGRVLLENSGNIGKSYRRHDEVGTPLCITLDFQSLEDQTVTVRNRDSMEQERIHQKETVAYLQEILK
jgi:glycyl-tRNA synthetase